MNASKPRILIFVVSYNAEQFIASVLERIPAHVWDNPDYAAEVLIIDDASSDQTFERAHDWCEQHNNRQITTLFNPVNQGYGGNQKLGYHYAIEKGFAAVVLLHGDGQYAPEHLDNMIRPIIMGQADIVFGSRMMNRQEALKGGMPIYKWIGNQFLTTIQNRILGSNLSEFHTGYRAYSCNALRAVPFEYNSNYFDFDTDIIIQMLDTKQRILEVSIPTFYGDEVSRVNVWRYGLLILGTSLQSRFVPVGLLYKRKFDYSKTNDYYTAKLGYASSHQFALDQVQPDMRVLDIGSGPGYMAEAMSKKGAKVTSLDQFIGDKARAYSVRTIEADVEEFNFEIETEDVDIILMLDIIEHLHEPEEFMLRLRGAYGASHPQVILTTGNIAFFVVRLGLLLGMFNYGKRGILDRDHHRLFTFKTLKQCLLSTGYEIIAQRGIPAPYPLALGDNPLARLLLAINSFLIRLVPGFFSYQIAYIVVPQPTLNHLLTSAQTASSQRRDQYATKEIMHRQIGAPDMPYGQTLDTIGDRLE